VVDVDDMSVLGGEKPVVAIGRDLARPRFGRCVFELEPASVLERELKDRATAPDPGRMSGQGECFEVGRAFEAVGRCSAARRSK
jgi:hypothetical protein